LNAPRRLAPPSATVFWSGEDRPPSRPRTVSGTRPGEQARTLHDPSSSRLHQWTPSNCTNLVWMYSVGMADAPEPATRSLSSVSSPGLE
jgi:hypothetical protein